MISGLLLGRWLVGLWAAGVAVLAARYWLNARRLSGIIGRSGDASDEVVAEFAAVSARFGGAGGVRVRRSAEVCAPCLAGGVRPVLLLPERQCQELERGDLRAILCHELAHARGHDLLWNNALHLVAILLWFHPLVWRARQAHAAACDAVCDAVAAEQLGDVASYSRTLARLALQIAGSLPAQGLAMARVADVRHRIAVLNRRVFFTPLSWRVALPAMFALGLCVVLIGGLGFTRAGQVATTDDRKVAAKPTVLAAKLSASGTVVDAEGRPVAGATVILREWSAYRVWGVKQEATERLIRGEEVPDVLAETKTDDEGRFQFHDVPAPAFPEVAEAGKSVFPWDVVALAKGHGLAWVQLTLQHQRTPIALTLAAEGTLRGRIVEPGGKPVAGAKVKVHGVDPTGVTLGAGVETENRLNLNWAAFPLGATTDRQGRFTIHGLPREKVATVVVTDPRHERLCVFAATTDTPQPENVSRRYLNGKAHEIRDPIYTGEFTLTAKTTDHILTGQLHYEADGKAAAGAIVMYDGFQLRTDANGRFRIEGLASGTLELHAAVHDTDSAPLDTAIVIPQEPKETEHNFILPKGLVLRGRVVDGTTGRGVEKALLYFVPDEEEGKIPTVFGFSEETDADGRYRLVVPAGRGVIDVRTLPEPFTPPQSRYAGQPREPKFSRPVAGRGGDTLEVAEFRLMRGRVVTLRVIDLDGRPVANAQVYVRDMSRRFDVAPGRTDAEGQYEAIGLSPDHGTVIDITAANRPLGATLEIAERETGGGETQSLEVRLQPLVSLTGRVLDVAGKPLVGPLLHLYRDVTDPEQSGQSFGMQVETRHRVEDDGTYKFDRLIPGATYNVDVEVEGHAKMSGQYVKIKPGQPVHVDDFRLPLADQPVKGIVVDARGKPLAGVTVSYKQRDWAQPLYAPAGGVWFQDTNAFGRFQLNSLPRGPIQLMVYSSPGAGEREIRKIKYVDVPPERSELRIELPDPNDRLRGID